METAWHLVHAAGGLDELEVRSQAALGRADANRDPSGRREAGVRAIREIDRPVAVDEDVGIARRARGSLTGRELEAWEPGAGGLGGGRAETEDGQCGEDRDQDVLDAASLQRAPAAVA
jgi:hypothetical protein